MHARDMRCSQQAAGQLQPVLPASAGRQARAPAAHQLLHPAMHVANCTHMPGAAHACGPRASRSAVRSRCMHKRLAHCVRLHPPAPVMRYTRARWGRRCMPPQARALGRAQAPAPCCACGRPRAGTQSCKRRPQQTAAESAGRRPAAPRRACRQPEQAGCRLGDPGLTWPQTGPARAHHCLRWAKRVQCLRCLAALLPKPLAFLGAPYNVLRQLCGTSGGTFVQDKCIAATHHVARPQWRCAPGPCTLPPLPPCWTAAAGAPRAGCRAPALP